MTIFGGIKGRPGDAPGTLETPSAPERFGPGDRARLKPLSTAFCGLANTPRALGIGAPSNFKSDEPVPEGFGDPSP